MPKTKKLIVTRPTKGGGLSTYSQSYNVNNTPSKESDNIINSIKIQHAINERYLLKDYLRSLKLSNFATFDIKLIISKVKNLNDIEELSKFIIDNIDHLNLMVICGIFNNIPNKYEYYEIIFRHIIDNLNISDDKLYSLIYSLNDHDMVLGLLRKSNKLKTEISNIINPCNIIRLYYSNINPECIYSAINSFNNNDNILKYLSNNIKLSTVENRILGSFIKYNNNTTKDTNLYLTSFVNISPYIAADIYKRDIDIDIGLYSSGVYELSNKKKDIDKFYYKIKDINVNNNSNFIINNIGYYLDNNNKCYLIMLLEINSSNMHNFNFIALPSKFTDIKIINKIMKTNGVKNKTQMINYNYKKYLVCNK